MVFRQYLCTLLLFILFASLIVSSVFSCNIHISNGLYAKIYRFKGKYMRQGKPFPPETVAKLIELSKQPVVSAYRLPESKSAHLQGNWKLALNEYVKRKNTKLFPGQSDVFQRAFETYSDRTHTTINYREPDIKKNPIGNIYVTLITKSGQGIYFSSENNYPVLAPWAIETRKGTIRTYNNELTNMLVSLFDKDCLDCKDEEVSFRAAIADNIIEVEHYDEWNKLEVDHRFSKEMSMLNKHFTVSKPRVDNSVAAIFNPFGKYLFATLQDSGMPSNFRIGVALKIQDDKPQGLGKFIAKTKSTIDFIKSVPHLQTFIRKKQSYMFKLRYADESFLPSQSQTELEEDLKSTKGVATRRQLWIAMKGVELTVANRDNRNDRARLLLFQDKRTFLWSATKQCSSSSSTNQSLAKKPMVTSIAYSSS